MSSHSCPRPLRSQVTLLGARATSESEPTGSAKFPNGDTYNGEYANGVRHGTGTRRRRTSARPARAPRPQRRAPRSGTYVYASGPAPEEGEEAPPPKATYEGKWHNNKRKGVGVMTYADGSKCAAPRPRPARPRRAAPARLRPDTASPSARHSPRGARHAWRVRVYTWRRYHGEWRAGKRSGVGTFYYVNGDMYTGDWSNGQQHGQGQYHYKASGARLEGRWEKGALVSGTFTDKCAAATRTARAQGVRRANPPHRPARPHRRHGGTYAGAFNSDGAGVNYAAGGTFTAASGATATAA